ncbi:MAG: acetate--CoA ligase family protein [Nitrosopumilus sp.]|nr:acetate--CoA ligase family protein [Nitrosopumilus sp.]
MRLLEYQAKELFAEYGIRIPEGRVARSIAEAREHAAGMGYPFVLKIQVPVGGRGKAGGVRACHSADELEAWYPQVSGLVIKGEHARAVMLEKMAEIKQEIYLAVFLDRSRRSRTVIASAEGGVEIESAGGKITREVGLDGIDAAGAAEVAREAGLEGGAAEGFANILEKLSRLAVEKEAELAEINPLALLADGSVVALDGKVVTDDNSSYRHPELERYAEKSEAEVRAEKSGFSLVELDGDVAVVGNGAGLVMSTLDMLVDAGGRAACFLDVGGGATAETVHEALSLIGRMEDVRGVLVNLYGGIVRTTVVAEALLRSSGDGSMTAPVFARLKGAESEKAREMLQGSEISMFGTVEEAINAAVSGRKG